MDNKELFFNPGNTCPIVAVGVKAVYNGILPASLIFKVILLGRMTEADVVHGSTMCSINMCETIIYFTIY